MKNFVNDVSDTSLWIAGYRALESERADAAFEDPLARKLAGDRGVEMTRIVAQTESMAFAMIVRTTAIDRLIESAIHLGIDAVVNLGAGLDTRPYRMKLRPDLKWIEVDFQSVIEYKNAILKSEIPVCKLERVPCDLVNTEERKTLFHQLASTGKNILVITEGIIGYLSNDVALEICRDLYSIPTFNYWIQDYRQGKLRNNKQQKSVGKELKNAPLLFDVSDPLGFFSKEGWSVKENIFILDEADRIGKKLPVKFPWNMLFLLFPRLIRKLANKTYGFVMFGRTVSFSQVSTADSDVPIVQN